MTGLQFIKQAMFELGAIDLNRAPNGAEADYGFAKLNQLVGIWNLQKRILWAWGIYQETFPSSQQSYTIGVGGELNATRPVRIEYANIVLLDQSPNVFVGVTLLETKEYLGISVPGIAANIPVRAYYDQAWSAGLGRVYFNPYPSAPLPAFQWMTRQQITEFVDLTTDYTFPPGYEGALVFSLAETMTALSPPAENLARVQQQARYFRAQIASSNLQPPRITADLGLRGGATNRADFNWLTGNMS